MQLYAKINIDSNQRKRMVLNTLHSEFWLRNSIGKTCLWKKLLYSPDKGKVGDEGIFEIVHCPFEGPAKLHHLCQPKGLVGWC